MNDLSETYREMAVGKKTFECEAPKDFMGHEAIAKKFVVTRMPGEDNWKIDVQCKGFSEEADISGKLRETWYSDTSIEIRDGWTASQVAYEVGTYAGNREQELYMFLGLPYQEPSKHAVPELVRGAA